MQNQKLFRKNSTLLLSRQSREDGEIKKINNSLRTQYSKFETWWSEAEHATYRSQRLPTICTSEWGRNVCFFENWKPEPRPNQRILSINQSIKQSINQSINQIINLSINQSINQSNFYSTYILSRPSTICNTNWPLLHSGKFESRV